MGQSFLRLTDAGSRRLHSGGAAVHHIQMRPVIFLALACLLALPGCLPLQTYYRAGVSVDRLNRDEAACDVAALRDAPVANETRIEPPIFVPPRQSCTPAGVCTTQPGYWIPGDVYTVDVNRPLRQQLTRQCMADKGYDRQTIDPCPPAIARAAADGATQVLPPLGPQSCVIRNDDGSFLIVNRG